METTYGGKGRQTEDGEAGEDQKNEASYLCAECGCGEDIMGFVGEFVGFAPLLLSSWVRGSPLIPVHRENNRNK